MSNIIETQNIKYAYEGEEISFALNGVSISVKKGEFVGILGHNGSGKSTFAKHINALIVPNEGTVTVAGMDTRDEMNRFNIRKTAGMVFQNPDNQLVSTVVEEDVAFGPENLGIPQTEIIERVETALETVGMSEYAKRPPHMLSGGQKQRIAIAGVLALRPDIIVFDEPTAMLDPAGRQEVMDTIYQLNKEGKTILFITHYMEEVEQADRIIVLVGGQVAAEGTPAEVFARRDVLEEAGLLPPFAAQLYDELKDSADFDKCPSTTLEMVDKLCQLI